MRKWVDIDFEIEQTGSESWHDGFEISAEVDALANLNIQPVSK